MKVLEFKSFRFSNEKQKRNPEFPFISLLDKKKKIVILSIKRCIIAMNSKFHCHHKLSFHVTINLFLFKTLTFFLCVILPLNLICETEAAWVGDLFESATKIFFFFFYNTYIPLVRKTRT